MIIKEIFKRNSVREEPNPKTVPAIDKRLKQITKQLKKNNLNSLGKQSLKDEYESLRTRLVVMEFEEKSANPAYDMGATAKKVFEVANKITENADESEILRYGPEYAFLTSDRHHLHKHIETLDRWKNPNSSKAVIDHEGIKLRTYTGSGQVRNHLASELMKKAQSEPNLVYELTHFSLAPREEHPKKLQPAFKIKGDGDCHVGIVTDCPTENLAISGQHTWLRLIDSNGTVYSVGKFPKKIRFPFLYAKESAVFSTADRHEWLCRDNTIQEHRFTISKKQYDKLVKSIEKDLNNSSRHDFNFFKENCSDWALQKLSDLNVHKFDMEKIQVDQFSFLFPGFGKWHDKMLKRGTRLRKISTLAQKVLSFATLQLARVALVITLGGMKKNKENEYSKRFMNRPFSKIFDPTLTKVTPPVEVRSYLNERFSNRLVR
jgi:hypothetical protein